MQAITVFVFIILGACTNGTPVEAHNAGAAKQLGTFDEVRHMITSAPLSPSGNNTTISQESLPLSGPKKPEEFVAPWAPSTEAESTTTLTHTTLADISKRQ